MNHRLDVALNIYPVKCWSDRLSALQYKLAGAIVCKPTSWAFRACSWHPPDTMPVAARTRGRPLCRWDDCLNKFSSIHFGKTWIDAATQDPRGWRANLEGFVEFMRE